MSSSHGHATTVDNTPTSGTHMQQLIKDYGPKGVAAVALLVVLFWVGSAVNTYRATEAKNEADMSKRIQTEEQHRQLESTRMQRVCGSMNEPACVCQGADTVMRYLKPRQTAMIQAFPGMTFDPSPGDGYRLCHPAHKDEQGNYSDCITAGDQHLNVGLTVAAESTSDKVVPLMCVHT